MWDGMERRKFPRVQYPCLITLRKETPPSISILTHTENISVGGVRVIIAKKINPLKRPILLTTIITSIIVIGLFIWWVAIFGIKPYYPFVYQPSEL